ncbi:superoxide dismutase family protein [Virgibacillus sp. DJP39]|uniref:superoxide dismutase family protein n=1 Tax=Virgibacillus sp. DJP39 TaxID=3409790 RepID=UPI003BB507D7
MIRKVIAVLIFIILFGCQGDEQTSLTVDMYNAAGDMVGTAKFGEQPEGVSIKVKVEGLTPGLHGIHVHEFPECEGPDFKSAGNHFNPEGKEHGLMNPKGPHLGDLPNVEADASGVVDVELMLASATMLEGKSSIFKNGGKSLIIHSEQDDGVSQPSGESGERLICGEIKLESKEDSKESPTDPTENNEKKKK